MRITKSLEEKTNKQIFIDLESIFCVLTNSSGSYTYQEKETGKEFNPTVSFNEFMNLMPQMGESKCNHYGSDD